MEKAKNFTYYDGVNTFKVEDTFQGNLAGEYDVVSKSFVQVGENKIKLLENRKTLSTFKNLYFNEEELKNLSAVFNMNLIYENSKYYLKVKGHYHGFDIVENDNLIVIYSLEGTKAPESMFIYGVWLKENNKKWL